VSSLFLYLFIFYLPLTSLFPAEANQKENSAKNPATMDAQTYQQAQTTRMGPPIGGMIPGLPMPNISGQPNGLVGRFAWTPDYLVPIVSGDVPDWDGARRPLANMALQVISSRDPWGLTASSRTRR